MRTLTPLFLGGVAAMVFVSAGRAQEPTPTSSARIGTYDSRAIAIAFYRSALFREQMQPLIADLEEAKASGDEWWVMKFDARASAMGHRMHQQSFSTASVREIMEKIGDALPQIAQEADVSIIVSKWEVAYTSPAADLVDVTPQLVAQFAPSDGTERVVESLKTRDPVPIDRLLVQHDDEERKLSIADSIRAVIDQHGWEIGIEHYRELRNAAVEHYRRLQEAIPKEYNFAESELNNLGYHYLTEGQTEIAIAIFKLNVEAYPDAYNTFDSLGEAYMEAGQTDLAIQHYQRSLELNPDNDNARQMLRRMGVDVELRRQ